MSSIFGGNSNLPPGCSVSDIPGNTPEDERAEAIYENFFDKNRMKNRKFGIRISGKESRAMDAVYRAKKYRKIREAVDTYIIAAIEYGMEIGSAETRENILSSQAEYKDYINGKRIPKLRTYFKHLRDTRKELYEALNTLIKKYWANKGSSGKFPYPGEFIACITPSGIPSYWKVADKAIAQADTKPTIPDNNWL